MDLFSRFFEPTANEVDVLTKKNQNFCTTRDLSLSKLISGELTWKTVDIDTGLAAEALLGSPHEQGRIC